MEHGGKRLQEAFRETANPEDIRVNLSGREDTLPCPFCGKHDIWALSYETPVGRRWYANCSICGAMKDAGYYHTWQQALSGWNNRDVKGADT